VIRHWDAVCTNLAVRSDLDYGYIGSIGKIIIREPLATAQCRWEALVTPVLRSLGVGRVRGVLRVETRLATCAASCWRTPKMEVDVALECLWCICTAIGVVRDVLVVL
jgi:hypothetical protein